MISIVAKRYAQAFFDLALRKRVLPAVRGEMDGLAALAAGSQEFTDFLKNPVIKDDARLAVLDEVLGASSSLVKNFLHLLVEKQRTGLLPDICRAVADLHDEDKGILRVSVTSARPLSPQQVKALSTKLASKYSRQIELTPAVDATLIGGFRYRVGDEITDLSVAHQLEQFRLKVLTA